MGKIAFVFSGQGAQYPGMGKSLYDTSPAAAAVFDMADALRPGTSDQCFAGNKQELGQTANTQPCVFTVDLAAARALDALGVKPGGAAGFSLGEPAAAAFCGVMRPEDAFSFVLERAARMDACAKTHPGGMAAVLKLDSAQVRALCKEAGETWPVNFNCPGQIVAAGTQRGIDRLTDLVARQGGRALKLTVSGAFHSPLMHEAAEGLRTRLKNMNFKQAEIPLYSNVTAQPYGEPADLLSKQVDQPVQWQNTIENMIADGFDTFIEVGPGQVLCGLIRKISADAAVYHAEDGQSLNDTARALGCIG